MGTNFYWHYNICQYCGRHDSAHVGKRSMGWSFSFRAWPHKLQDESFPDWGYHPESPFGFEVMSRADWRRVFEEFPGTLYDEYNREEAEDPIAWLMGLEAPTQEQLNWESAQRYTWNSEAFTNAYERFEHRDPEGFRFGAYEFS